MRVTAAIAHGVEWLAELANRNFTPISRRRSVISKHTPKLRDVLLSGGDALIFSDDRLEKLLSRLRTIRHIEFLRIGTRVPIFLPQRITPELCAMLAKYHPLWMSVHVNHPRELTIEVKQRVGASRQRRHSFGQPECVTRRRQ